MALYGIGVFIGALMQAMTGLTFNILAHKVPSPKIRFIAFLCAGLLPLALSLPILLDVPTYGDALVLLSFSTLPFLAGSWISFANIVPPGSNTTLPDRPKKLNSPS